MGARRIRSAIVGSWQRARYRRLASSRLPRRCRRHARSDGGRHRCRRPNSTRSRGWAVRRSGPSNEAIQRTPLGGAAVLGRSSRLGHHRFSPDNIWFISTSLTTCYLISYLLSRQHGTFRRDLARGGITGERAEAPSALLVWPHPCIPDDDNRTKPTGALPMSQGLVPKNPPGNPYRTLRLPLVLLACAIASLAAPASVKADLIIDIVQSGSDVVATATGTLDLAGLSGPTADSAAATIIPGEAAILVGGPGVTSFEYFAGISGPSAWGGPVTTLHPRPPVRAHRSG